MVKLINGLEEAGLVERRRRPNDRRAWEVVITAQGRRTLVRTWRLAAQVEDKVLGGLTVNDRRKLLTLLRRALASAPPQPQAWARKQRVEENDMFLFTKKGDAAVLAKLDQAPEQYREIGQRLHGLVRKNAPSLEPIVRWGLPFYVKDGKDICYIKPGKDFIAFGFGEAVNPAHEEGSNMDPVVWNITSLDAATEAKISDLIKKAVA